MSHLCSGGDLRDDWSLRGLAKKRLRIEMTDVFSRHHSWFLHVHREKTLLLGLWRMVPAHLFQNWHHRHLPRDHCTD
jgi:hypothetical protein